MLKNNLYVCGFVSWKLSTLFRNNTTNTNKCTQKEVEQCDFITIRWCVFMHLNYKYIQLTYSMREFVAKLLKKGAN